uniref:hypothetical protein n=1 Tax=uncultured Bilophila sp. TaxID=529385 RepID=UPI0025F8D767|nr:hypothetical protein [uncultured Bilophila sp.]
MSQIHMNTATDMSGRIDLLQSTALETGQLQQAQTEKTATWKKVLFGVLTLGVYAAVVSSREHSAAERAALTNRTSPA